MPSALNTGTNQIVIEGNKVAKSSLSIFDSVFKEFPLSLSVL